MGFEIMFAVIIQSKENKPSSTKKYRFDTVEILRFPKGLTHDFGQKLELLFLDKISLEIMSDDHPSRKLALLNYKNINFTKS